MSALTPRLFLAVEVCDPVLWSPETSVEELVPEEEVEPVLWSPLTSTPVGFEVVGTMDGTEEQVLS